MADDHTSKLEQELKDRLEEKGILYFGPLGKHYLKDARGQHMPHTPRQQPHGRRPGKRNMMTHLRAYARKNPGSKVPSWLAMEQMSHEEVFNQFKEKFPKLIQANGQIRRIVEGDPNDPEGFNREEAKIQGGTRMQGGGAGKTPTVDEIDIDSAEVRQERAVDPKSTRVEPKDRKPGEDVVDYNPFGFANERTRAQRAGVRRPEARGPFNRNPQSMFMPGDAPAEQKQEEAIARAEEIRQKAQQAAAQGKNPPAAAAAQYNNKEEQVIVVAEDLFRALNELDGAMDGLSSEDRKALSEIEQLGMDNPPAARKKLSEMAANNPRMKKAKEAFDKAAKAARNVAKAANKNGMKQIPSELLEAAALRVGKGKGPRPEDMGQFEQQMAQPNIDVNAPKSMYGPQQVDYADGVIDARESLDRARQGNADFEKDFGGDNWPIDRIIKDPPRNEDEISAAMKQQQKGRAGALANAEEDPDNAGQHFAEAQAHEDAMDALQALGKMPAEKRDALKRDRKIEQKPAEGGEGGKKPPSDIPVANMPGTQPEDNFSGQGQQDSGQTKEIDSYLNAEHENIVDTFDMSSEEAWDYLGELHDPKIAAYDNAAKDYQKDAVAQFGSGANQKIRDRIKQLRNNNNEQVSEEIEAEVRSLIEDALIGGIDDDIKDGLYESRSEAAKDRLEDISSGDNGYDAWVQNTSENLRNQGQDWVTEDYVKGVHQDILNNLAGNKKDQEPNQQQQEKPQLPERLVTRPARELGIENTQQMRQRNVGTQAQMQDLRLTQEEGDIARQAGKDELAKPQKVDRMRAAGRFVDANIADAMHKEGLSNEQIQAKRGEIIGEALLEAGVTNHKDWDKKGPEWVKQLGERFDLRLKGKAETEDELKRARQIIQQEQMQDEQGDWQRQGRLRRGPAAPNEAAGQASPEGFTEVSGTELDQAAMAQVVDPEDVSDGKMVALQGFRNRELANQKAAQLIEQGYDAKPVRNKRFWEVEVGEGKNKEQASAGEAAGQASANPAARQLPERLVTRPAQELGIANTQQMRERNVGTQAGIQDLRLTADEGKAAQKAGEDELAKPKGAQKMRAAGRFVDAKVADAEHGQGLSDDQIKERKEEIIQAAIEEAKVTEHKDWPTKEEAWRKELGERFDLRLKGKAETDDEKKRARQIIQQEQVQGEQGDWQRQGRLRRREGTQPEDGTGGQPVEPPNTPSEGDGGVAEQGDKAFQRLANPNRNAAKLGQINIEAIDQKAQRLRKLALDAAGPSGESAGSVGGKDNFNGALPIQVVKVDDSQDKKIVTPNPIPRDQAEQIAKRLEAKGIKVDIISHPTASQDDKDTGRSFAVRANNAEMFVVKPEKEAKQEKGYREAAELLGVGHLVPVVELDKNGKVLIEFIDGNGASDMVMKNVPEFLRSANKYVSAERAAVVQDKDFDTVVDADAVKAVAGDRAFAKEMFEFVVEAAADARLSDSSQSLTPAQARAAAEGDVRMIAALDFLLGQPDRHGDNINIGPNGEVRAIDNGFVGLAVIPDPLRFLGNGNGEVPLLQRGVQPNDGPGATATQIQVDVPENIRQIFLQVTAEDIKRMAGNVDADSLVTIWTEMIGKRVLKHNPKALKDFQDSIKKYFTGGGYEADMLSRLESLQNGSYQYDLKSIQWEDLPYKVKKKYLQNLLDKLPSGYSTSDITPQW